MTFIDSTLNWVKGEMLEAGMLAIWGAALILLAGYFWLYGHSPSIRALIIPFLVAGLIWGAAGGASLYRNAQRVDQYQLEYAKDQDAFVQKESERVDGFVWTYRYLLITWSLMILAGLAAFMLWGGNLGRAVGLGLVLFATGGLMVDHTSEQNAHAYKAEIDKALN